MRVVAWDGPETGAFQDSVIVVPGVLLVIMLSYRMPDTPTASNWAQYPCQRMLLPTVKYSVWVSCERKTSGNTALTHSLLAELSMLYFSAYAPANGMSILAS